MFSSKDENDTEYHSIALIMERSHKFHYFIATDSRTDESRWRGHFDPENERGRNGGRLNIIKAKKKPPFHARLPCLCLARSKKRFSFWNGTETMECMTGRPSICASVCAFWQVMEGLEFLWIFESRCSLYHRCFDIHRSLLLLAYAKIDCKVARNTWGWGEKLVFKRDTILVISPFIDG